jgi:DNA-binding transcriptional regulator LsrR (DeoR family)
MEEEIHSELVAIKRLLIFAIMKGGATQAQIASALQVDQSVISRMLSKGKGK